MKAGYIYILTHPSDPSLYKVGITIRDPIQRLAEHNRDFTQAAGRIVQETGQRWEIKEYHAVADPYLAERVFWGATPYADIPYREGIEIQRMCWHEIQAGLSAAKTARMPPHPALNDWVYAYTASMKKRLAGRDITLLGYVKSMASGKASFRCSNGHEWRTCPLDVAEGAGCPECGVGKMAPEDIRRAVGFGVICLLTHAEKPGLIHIGISQGTWEVVQREWPWGDWESRRYRHTEELDLAESLVWELMGLSRPADDSPVPCDLTVADEAFRKLHYAIQEQIAFEEKRRALLTPVGSQ
jgi:hypothetical protein